jgi:hypothetical protein
MSKTVKRARIVPRLGPPTNLRPGGAHKNRAKKSRSEDRRRAMREWAE